MEYITLNNGVKMPYVGLGTSKLAGKGLKELIKDAYDLGYRKFDSAWRYDTESAIGETLKYYHIPREKLFLTSKLHINNLYIGGRYWTLRIPSCKTIKSAFEDSCKRMKTNYLDLYLVHWPFPDYLHMWEEIEKLYHAGRIRAIGVCSFLQPHLEALKRVSDIVPAVNQFEISPLNTRIDLIEYCQKNNIQVEAYSTFGSGNAIRELMQNPALNDFADKYNKSVAQVILRWVVQQNIAVIPRSNKIYKLKENLDLFDFALTEEEMSVIKSLNRDVYFGYDPHLTL